jgi:hypothetical protein
MTKPLSKAQEVAQKFVTEAQRLGFVIEVTPGTTVIKVGKRFPVGDKAMFTECDMDGPCLLGMLGARGGSQWGTDGGSVGGHSALIHGFYQLNQSGVPLRVCAAVAKLA